MFTGVHMEKKFTRRDFIKIAGVGTAGAVGLTAGGSFIKAATSADPADDRKGKVVKTPTYCEMCTYQCAGFAYVKDGNPWKIEGNPIDEHCYGKLCTKGTSGFGAYSDPDRLKKPLIRVEERGKQVFREATWDEALDFIADRMKDIKKKYGSESMAMFSHGSGSKWFAHMLSAYGSRSIAEPSYGNCRGPREEGYMITYGEPIDSPERTDMKNSKCIVLMGSHLGENTLTQQVIEFTTAISKGATIIVVDPRFSTAASKAKYWLPITPSTDIALLLAWINVLITEDIYNKDYVEKYCFGFDQLKAQVKNYTPEWAYPITGISPDMIRVTAREMAKNAPSTLVHPGRYTVWTGDDTQRTRANGILNALLGSWGQEGGFFMPESASVPAYPYPKYPEPSAGYKDAIKEQYPLGNLALTGGVCEATIPDAKLGQNPFYRGWIIYGTNLIKSLPDREQTIKALQGLDLVVAIDILPTEITGYADVVLPDTTYLERYDDIRVSSTRDPQIALRMPAMKPLYDSKPAWWIARELGIKLGLKKYFPWKNVEEYLDYRLKRAGTSLKEMQRVGIKNYTRTTPMYITDLPDFKFFTNSGKIEIYSHQLADHGFDPIPRYNAHEAPREWQFRLLIGRTPFHSFSRTINNPILSQIQDENEVWINTDVAKIWGLKQGQYIRLKNQDGALSQKIKVKVTERIRQDCIFMTHGFGQTQKQLSRSYMKGAADEWLMTRVKIDPIMGGQALNLNFVTFVLGDEDPEPAGDEKATTEDKKGKEDETGSGDTEKKENKNEVNESAQAEVKA